MLVIMLNCVTLGMFRPCEDVECRSERCSILEVGVKDCEENQEGAKYTGLLHCDHLPPRPLTTSSLPSSLWRWLSRWWLWGCLGRSAIWVTPGTGWTSSLSWRGMQPQLGMLGSPRPDLRAET